MIGLRVYAHGYLKGRTRIFMHIRGTSILPRIKRGNPRTSSSFVFASRSIWTIRGLLGRTSCSRRFPSSLHKVGWCTSLDNVRTSLHPTDSACRCGHFYVVPRFVHVASGFSPMGWWLLPPSISWDVCVASTHATVCQQIVLAVASIRGTAYGRTCTVPLESPSSVRRTEGTAGGAVASSRNVLESSIV